MGVVFDIVVLIFGVLGIFGLGVVFGVFFYNKIDWSLFVNEDNKKVGF